MMSFFIFGATSSSEDGGSIDLIHLLYALIILLVFTLIIYLIYSGLLTSIEVVTKEPTDIGDSGLVVAYKTGRGPYKQAGEIFTETFCLAPDRNTIGIYYDDPESCPPQELRYAVGCILSSSGDIDLKAEAMHKMISNGFKIAHFPKPNYAVMSFFPFRTTLSIYIAIYRVYPKLKNYITSQGLCAYPAIEIYTPNEIQFMMPLSRQDEFYVPEFSEEEVSIATTEVSSFADSQHYQKDVIMESGTPKRDDDVFVKPPAPPPLPPTQKPDKKEKNNGEESNEAIDRSESTSSFEDLGSSAVKEELQEEQK